MTLSFEAFAAENSRGRASWYGTTAHGKQTANGEIYNRHELTAAHRQLPFGSIVRVKNKKNNKHILVRINDRGPFIRGRVIDVSRRAADLLAMTETGVVPVAIEVVGDTSGEPLNKDNAFFVHIADVAGAMNAREHMTLIGDSLKMPLRAILLENNDRQFFAVCSGPYATFQEAHSTFLKLDGNKFGVLGIIEAPKKEKMFAIEVPLASDSAQSEITMADYRYAYRGEHAIFMLLKNCISPFPAMTLQSSVLCLDSIQERFFSLSQTFSFLTLPYQGHSGYKYYPT